MNNIAMLKTVRGKLLILAICVEVLMLTILVANSTRLLNTAMTKQSSLQAEQIHPVLAAALTAPLAQRDFATVKAVIDESRKAGGIDYIAVSDKKGKITAVSGWHDNEPLPAPSKSSVFSIFTKDKISRYDVVIPINQASQNLGTLHLGLDLSQIIEARKNLLLQGIIIATIEIVLSSIVLFLIISWLTRHLNDLTQASLNVAKGDFSPTNMPEGSDDIGQLGHAFNTMTQTIAERVSELTITRNKLHEYSKQLMQFNSTLETRIQDEVIKNREKDQKLVQSDKMASIGQLAAGVAHEINNPMGFISSNLNSLTKYVDRIIEFISAQEEAISENCKTDITDNISKKRKQLKIDYIIEDTQQLIKESLEGAERVQLIVKGLKSFSRLDQAKHTLIDINECLDTTINIAWNEIKYVATLNREYGVLPPINCFPQQINQVFLNMLINSAQSINEHGTITVKTWYENRNVFISISDTGSGIPEENLNRLFEPFFTTKDVGKGTGLGLSISYEIIKNHNGDIAVESSLGKGTTFTIRLPEGPLDDGPESADKR